MPTLTSLVGFNGADGSDPQGELIADSQGDLFGTSAGGGPNGGGTVFEIVYANGAYAAQPTILASFSNSDGIYAPVGPLVTNSAGTIFGETVGTDSNDNGSIFEIQKTASGYAPAATLWTFSYSANDITSPTGGLAIDSAGDLFSSESQAGAYGDGAVFELPSAGSGNYNGPQILASFNGSNGIAPTGPVVVDAAGDIFGTTVKGGANGDGTVFEIPHTASGYGSIVTLANFDGANGLYPGAIAMDSAGDLFGTTSPGSTVGSATVFEIAKTAGGYGDLTTLATFDNANQIGPISLDASGNIYGTTPAGGVNGMGSVFEIAHAASGYATTPTTLWNFGGSDGQTPSSAVLADAAGNLYGTTASGGANNDGTIYELNPTSGSGTGTVNSEPMLTTIAAFTGDNGAYPNSPLTSDAAGDLFGTTYFGGAPGSPNGNAPGVIYEIAQTADGYGPGATVLYNFAQDPNGRPNSPLVVDSAGDLFGTTSGGAVFELAKTASGYAAAPTTLATFASSPSALIMDSSGDLIGATGGGGANGDGSIFEIVNSASGYASTPTTLASFDGTNGTAPSHLVFDSSGDIFGIAAGSNGNNIVFELAHTAQGYASAPVTVAAIANTAPSGYSEAVTGLSIDASGNLFGTAVYNPAPAPMDNGPTSGTIFEIAKTASGYESTSTTLATGFVPWSGVTIDGAGNLWGTSRTGIFELPKEAGGYAATPTIISDAPTDQPLLADSNGNLLDVTYTGTYLNDGTAFELSNTGFVVPSGSGGTTGETLTANDTAGQQLVGTPYNDTFYAGHSSVVMTGNGGADTFIFPYVPWSAGSITDFNTADDKLDLSALLSAAGYTGSNPVGDGYLQFADDGKGDTQVYLNSHSASDPYPSLITTLDHVAPASITPADYGYGSSSGGGATVSVISTFSSDPEPNGTLAVDTAGNLFGTTQSGGTNSDGAIFEVANTGSGYAGTPTILASFDGADGQLPAAGLIADSAGNLFGVTEKGGANGDGAIFELAKTADGYAATPTLLASFDSGAVGPANQLVMDAAGDLFGITENGPFNATVFELAKTAGGYATAPTTLATFDTPNTPSPLAIDAHGDLFGVALSKSGPSTGSVFEIANTASGYATTTTTLATLGIADGTPSGALVADANGDLFGLTNGGGANSSGEIFEIAMTASGYASSPTVLASFPSENNHAGALMIDGAGDLFAQTLPSGGATGGELFELAKTDSGYASTLTAVTSLDGGGNSPMSGLAADSAGHLFGTASGNAPQQESAPNSTVYEITNSGFVPTSSGGGGTTGETLTADDSAGQHLTGTPNDDIFYAGHNSVVMTGDGGADTFVFQYEPWNAGSITDFTPGNDKLDLSALLTAAGYSGNDPVADGFVTFSSDGSGDTNVYFNPHDATQQWPSLITTLDGIAPTGLTAANTLGTAGSGGGGTGGGTTGETLTANDTAGQQLAGTPNDDTFYAGHNSVVMTGDGGADTFVFQYEPWNAGSITDFNTAADVLNLKGIFASIGYTGSNPVADGYLAFNSDGQGDTQVIVNPQGPATQIPITVTTLDHVDPSAVHSGDYLFA